MNQFLTVPIPCQNDFFPSTVTVLTSGASEEILSIETKGIPKYMNIKHHQETNAVPYTISTNMFYALVHAFNGIKNPEHIENIGRISDYIQNELSQIGFSFLGN